MGLETLQTEHLLSSYQSPNLDATTKQYIQQELARRGVMPGVTTGQPRAWPEALGSWLMPGMPAQNPSIEFQQPPAGYGPLTPPPLPTSPMVLPQPRAQTIEFAQPPAGYGPPTAPAAAPVATPVAEWVPPPMPAMAQQGYQGEQIQPEYVPQPVAAAAQPVGQIQIPQNFQPWGSQLDQVIMDIPAVAGAHEGLKQGGQLIADSAEAWARLVTPGSWWGDQAATPVAAAAPQPAAAAAPTAPPPNPQEIWQSWGQATQPAVTWSSVDPLVFQGESDNRNIATQVKKDDGTPGSTAFGPGQYTESTWRDMISRYPGLTWTDKEGNTRAFTKEDRMIPEAQLAMEPHYRKFHAEVLEPEIGRGVTDADLRVSRQVGPGGALALMKADPKAPADQVLNAVDPKILESNPTWRGKSVSDLLAHLQTYGGRVGGGNAAATAPAGGAQWGEPITALSYAPVDFSGMPAPPAMTAPDYTAADQAFAEAKPKAPQMVEGADLLAFLSGAASGARGAMSFAEALAGAGGEGLAALLGQKQYEAELDREHARALESYSMQKAQIMQTRAANMAELEAANDMNFYNHKLRLWEMDIEAQKIRQPSVSLSSEGLTTTFFNQGTGMMETSILPKDKMGEFLQRVQIQTQAGMQLKAFEAALDTATSVPMAPGRNTPAGVPIDSLPAAYQPAGYVGLAIMDGLFPQDQIAALGFDVNAMKAAAIQQAEANGLDPNDVDTMAEINNIVFGQIMAGLMNDQELLGELLQVVGPPGRGVDQSKYK